MKLVHATLIVHSNIHNVKNPPLKNDRLSQKLRILTHVSIVKRGVTSRCRYNLSTNENDVTSFFIKSFDFAARAPGVAKQTSGLFDFATRALEVTHRVSKLDEGIAMKARDAFVERWPIAVDMNIEAIHFSQV